MNREMELSQQVECIIGPSLLDLGYNIVCVSVILPHRVQILIEREDRAPIGVEDCAKASRTASLLLDVANPIRESYLLEVSSPGIDRPLIKQADYERFCGLEAEVMLSTHYEGRRRFSEKILGVQEKGGMVMVCLHVNRLGREEKVVLPLKEIRRAHLKEPKRQNGGECR
ncbi:MAG: ribosome maturation factor RimP [Holosporales bacterium]|jgi:ribosome maturation factor RimP|nr:ribosome maturation factor RimP [Holosporales bacterium]